MVTVVLEIKLELNFKLKSNFRVFYLFYCNTVFFL